MILDELLRQRPIVVAIAGPNGAGKSTFYEAFVADAGLRFVNADDLAHGLDLDAYTAAKLAASIREALFARGESFVFETVFSDPVGEKVELLAGAARRGYAVVLVFIGLATAKQSDDRVAIRVSQGGHDVPPGKIRGRFPRTLDNLERAIVRLPAVVVFDNANLPEPYRHVATFVDGRIVERAEVLPKWLKKALPAVD